MAKIEKAQEQQEADFFLQERADIVGLKRNQRESVSGYRSRVAGALRADGHIIEAHEALSGKLYDDPEQGPMGPMAGIIGAVAQAMRGKDYSTDPEQKVGDDLATGVLVQHGRDRGDGAITAIFSLLGPEVGIDIIEGLSKSNSQPPLEKHQRKPKKS